MSEPLIDFIGQIPVQTGEWDEDKYIKTLRYFASRWNQPLYGFAGMFNPIGNTVSGAPVEDTRFVPAYLENAAYIFGNQSNANYGFFILDQRGNQTSVPMFRGLDIEKLYHYYGGYVKKLIEPLPDIVGVSAYSENAIAAKKEMMDIIKFSIENEAINNIIQEYTGYSYKPINKRFENQAEQDKFFQNFQDGMEEAYHDISIDTIYRNNYLSTIPKPCDYAFIGGRGTIEVYEHNGFIYWRPIDPVCAIYDMSKNQDQHLEDDYGGELASRTVSEVVNLYGEKLQAKYGVKIIEEIEAFARSGADKWNSYNNLIGYNGLIWWNTINNVPHVSTVKMQWRSYKLYEGQYVECLREGVLIGNRWLVDEGESAGQVYDINKPSRKILRYITFSPNTLLGTNVGIVGLVKRFQNLKDAFTTRMTKMVANSFGKVTFIRASMLPEGYDSPDMISEMRQNNVVVINDEDIDETDADTNKKLVESADLTLDPGLPQLLGLIQYYDKVISDVLNMPDNLRGVPTSNVYQAKEVAQQNIQQGTLGMEYFYTNIRLWVERLISYSANLAKLTYPTKNREHLALVIGDAMTKMLDMDMLKKMQFEDFNLVLKFNDAIDNTERQEYREFIKGSVMQGNPMYKLSNMIRIDTMHTKSKVADYIEQVEYKFEQMQMAKEQQTLALQQQQNQNNNQTQQQMTNVNAETSLKKEKEKNDTKLLDTLIKEHSKLAMQEAEAEIAANQPQQ